MSPATLKLIELMGQWGKKITDEHFKALTEYEAKAKNCKGSALGLIAVAEDLVELQAQLEIINIKFMASAKRLTVYEKYLYDEHGKPFVDSVVFPPCLAISTPLENSPKDEKMPESSSEINKKDLN